MHDINLLPETETVRRQTRLLLLTAIGVTISSAFWITTTTLSQEEIKRQIQASTQLTESRIQPIPPLNNRVNDLRAQLEQRDPINAYIDNLPNRTNTVQTSLTSGLAHFNSDDRPDISIERIHLTHHATTPNLTLSGRALTLEAIAARLTRLNNQNIPVENPSSLEEPDGTTTFSLTIPLLRVPNDPTTHLTPNERNTLLNLTQPPNDPTTETTDNILDTGVDDLSDINLTGPPDTSDEAIGDILDDLESGER